VLLLNYQQTDIRGTIEKAYVNVFLIYTVYGRRSFLSKESDTLRSWSIYFAYDVGIISSYSNRTYIFLI